MKVELVSKQSEKTCRKKHHSKNILIYFENACICALFEPVTHTECGNMFCSHCLLDDRVISCPLCRKNLVPESLQPVITRYISQKLNELLVTCPGIYSLSPASDFLP